MKARRHSPPLCMIELSSVFKIHWTAAGKAVFTSTSLSGFGECLTIVDKMSIVVSCMSNFFSASALPFSKLRMLTWLTKEKLFSRKDFFASIMICYSPKLAPVALATDQCRIHFPIAPEWFREPVPKWMDPRNILRIWQSYKKWCGHDCFA